MELIPTHAEQIAPYFLPHLLSTASLSSQLQGHGQWFARNENSKNSPSLAISCTAKLPQDVQISPITGDDERGDFNSNNDSSASGLLKTLHISTRLMDDFLALSKSNTEKDLETCGILGAHLQEKETFYVTTLVIPKQESTSNSCQAINEEEVYAIHSERSLCPVGWIHTHPSQSCFMSSIDLHTHYPYQVMVPEAFAIVVAPTDASRSFGIFRLSDPGGMKILRECQEDGFHPHKDPEDGSPIYELCSNVYQNSNLRFEIIDLRS
ncbi:AMSH-like ubiquitin thioesterase 2 isoform X3 [Cucurbita pepo subsp. pepo]|uniref:AMSH-like ubiquitin thioesterase 2 isoform X3 n=1 Tax=Cucurbita pepo subsp. pepo TaxID=3664 RepID=UPI000C9DA29D|nr:AMSH-like ubiquitin thioesterase 2 isoform X3 [Cucurbita pepo subsp. pepo]